MNSSQIYVSFDTIRYKLILTEHGEKRLRERNISLETLRNSIEKYDKKYENYGKQVVEKNIKRDTIRTVFELKPKHIILITSIRLGK